MLLSQVGDIRWADLKTAFVDIRALLKYLKHEGFNGIIRLHADTVRGLILIQEGDVIEGIQQWADKRICGPASIRLLLDTASRDTSGILTVVRVSPLTIGILMKYFFVSVDLRQKNLTTDFTDFGAFVSKLIRQNFSGYLEIRTAKEAQTGTVYLHAGRICAIHANKVLFDLPRDASSKQPLIERYLNGMKNKRLSFDVYEAKPHLTAEL